MLKIITKDERYVIIVEEYQLYNEYNVYENFDEYAVTDNIDKDASVFFHTMIKEDVKPHITMSINSDGCCNMDGRADNVMTHFCDMSQIDSYYGMITTCYGHATERFNF